MDDATGRAAALAFVVAALGLLAEDGHFVEGGGHDTSYQGVALAAGEETLLAGDRNVDGQLARGLDAAARWLATRVGPDGAIDSSGNARTCGGGERTFGEPKRVAVPEVFTGLSLSGSRTGNRDVMDAARRLERWALHGSASDAPCGAAGPAPPRAVD